MDEIEQAEQRTFEDLLQILDPDSQSQQEIMEETRTMVNGDVIRRMKWVTKPLPRIQNAQLEDTSNKVKEISELQALMHSALQRVDSVISNITEQNMNRDVQIVETLKGLGSSVVNIGNQVEANNRALNRFGFELQRVKAELSEVGLVGPDTSDLIMKVKELQTGDHAKLEERIANIESGLDQLGDAIYDVQDKFTASGTQSSQPRPSPLPPRSRSPAAPKGQKTSGGLFDGIPLTPCEQTGNPFMGPYSIDRGLQGTPSRHPQEILGERDGTTSPMFGNVGANRGVGSNPPSGQPCGVSATGSREVCGNPSVGRYDVPPPPTPYGYTPPTYGGMTSPNSSEVVYQQGNSPNMPNMDMGRMPSAPLGMGPPTPMTSDGFANAMTPNQRPGLTGWVSSFFWWRKSGTPDGMREYREDQQGEDWT